MSSVRHANFNQAVILSLLMLMMTQVGFVEQFNPLISEEETQLPDETSVSNAGSSAVFSNTKISAGTYHTCAILDNGSVSCWGSGSNGKLGDGGISQKNTPTSTSSLGANRTAVAIAAGSGHTCVILDNGSVSCWGYGASGQMGNGGTSGSSTPTLTSSLGAGRTAVALSSGGAFTCAILDNGLVSCWGEGSLGQLGNGGTSNSLTPTLTSSLGAGRTAVAIEAGGTHACAILDNGLVSCWGSGGYGKLGNGNTTDSLSPILTSSLGAGRTAVALSAYDKHTCAILDNGSVSCWGYGGSYALGNGVGSSVNTPTLTSSLGANRTAVALGTGWDHTCAILDNGSVSCWGSQSSGKLGSGGTSGSLATPTLTGSLGSGRTAVAIYGGYAHNCVILDNGNASCWGYNGNGQLGNGGTTDQSYPTAVSGSDVFDSSTGSNALTASVEGAALTVDQAMTDITFQYNASSSSSSGSTFTNTSGSIDTSGDVGWHPSIANDSNGYSHISYFDDTNDDLKYATDESGSWVVTSVDTSGNVGSYTSIAVDSNDDVHISYYDTTNFDLKYATDKSGSWVVTSVDTSGSVGTYTSIAVDSNDDVHISYFDQTNGDLKYATDKSGSWVLSSVDTTGAVGQYTSIAVDSNDDVHISYYDDTNFDLKYATNKSGSWALTTIDTPGYIGKYTSIAVDSNDDVHISYYDQSNGDLKYATDKSGSWVTTSLDTSGYVGYYTSIAVDSNDDVHISYYDATNFDLKYATNKSGSWVLSSVDTTGAVGQYTSLAVDSNDDVHISYFDDTNNNLKYLTMNTGSSSSSAGAVFSNSKISSGPFHNCAIVDNGSVSCWGRNSYGELGDGTTTDRSTPTQTSSLGTGRTAVAISSGSGHTCAILDDASVSCWGWNSKGQLGDGTTTNRNTPTPTLSLGTGRTAVAISSGEYHTCAILDDASVSCWGRNLNGRLGDGTTTNRNTPTQTSSLGTGRTAVAISAGYLHTCAVLDNGSVSCWGAGTSGQLGDGTNMYQRTTPTQTSSLGTGRTAVAISSGDYFACALLDDASVSCWGFNNNGQLGDGTTTSRNTPTPTSSLGSGRTAVAISSGIEHTCAIIDNGSVSCWGYNYKGQLGDGTTASKSTPTQTASLGTGRTAVAISSGNGHTCAILDDASVSCWGANYYGELGDGTTTDQSTPGPVSGSDVFDNSTGTVGGMTDLSGATCSISPALPSGLSITQGTCSIGGTPLAESSNTTYTVSAILNTVTYQATVWLSATNVNTFTSTVDGADLSLGEAMTPITLNYTAESSGSTFTNTSGVVDASGNIGYYSSIANDSNGYRHISYYDSTNDDLKYATDKSGSWVVTSVDTPGNMGYYTSIAVDSNDDVHISYYDYTNFDLKYATDKSGSWVLTSVDTSGKVGHYTSIAVDSNDDVHISYYDLTTYDLKYATDKSGSWVLTSVDTSGVVGQYTSIAVDSNDDVHISYYDGTNADLKYATDKSGSWVVTSVDTNGSVGKYTSIAVDSNDDVHISYYDDINDDLKYATDKSGSWVVTSVDTSGDVGYYTSIAVDSNDDVHISYYDTTNFDLKYATDKSGSWVLTSVDTSGNVGHHSSIAVDSNDDVHISYYDGSNLDLKYLTMNTGSSSSSSSSSSTVFSNSKISSGGLHTCAILDNGSVSCWGKGTFGGLGNGGTSDKTTPTLTSSLGAGRTAVAISSGGWHTCAILDNGLVSCWGSGAQGQLGNGSTSNSLTPTLTSSLGSGRTAVAISSGRSQTCALLDNGSVSCWGLGSNGQLGNGGTTQQNSPTLTSSFGAGRTAVAISSGGYHTCAILDNGSVSCWGLGSNGQLGNASTSKQYSPTLTSSLGSGRTAVAISTGERYTCAILDDGTVSCWGQNQYGQLGDGTSTQRATPTQTSSLGTGRTADALSSGSYHACAILDDGLVSCWGRGGNGQLGNGGLLNSLSPTLTSSLGVGRTAVTISGNIQTCAILDNGNASCWGYNSNGQLGDGTTSGRLIPTAVSGTDVFNSSTGTSTAATWEIEPALPAGMSLAGGVISGTPSVYAKNQTYTVYANESGHSTTFELWFTVDTTNPHTVVENQAIDAIGFHPPFNNGTTTWTASANLPGNLTIDASTGEITGTVISTFANATITVTATHNGSAIETFTFNLQSLADYDGDGLANELPIDYNSAEQPTSGLVADDDDDADGLLDSVETNTGIYIDATDTGTDPLNPDTDDDGICDGPNAVPPICIAGPDPDPNGVLPPATLVGVNNTAINTLAPYMSISGGTYEISPNLPATLSLDANNGEISGTPTETLANTTFTVWVNHSGSTSLSWDFTVEILEDTDGDGMPNVLPGDYDSSNPDSPGLVEDTDDDNDGISDIDEQNDGTNPLHPDTDGDGMCDGEIASTYFDPNCGAGPDAFPTDPSADTDTDGDGDPDTLNPPSNSDPVLVEDLDDDGDGLDDVNETNTGIANGDTDTGTDPLNPDSDFDGICDGPIAVPPICIAGPDETPLGQPAEGVIYALNNSQMSSLVPSHQLPAATWEISPDLPAGITIDATSGIISGTPTEIIGNTTFTIYGNATGSTISFDFNLQVLEDTDRDGEPNQLPTDYPEDGELIEDLDDDGDGAPDLSETGTGFYNGTDDMGTDPLDPDTDDDGICDGPNDVLPICIGGPDSNPFGTGPLGPTVLVNNTLTTPLPPANAVPGATWEISPALPEGLVLDTNTGIISGTPTQTLDNTTFTVWANTTTPSMSIVSTFWLEVLEDSDGDGMPDSLPEDYPETDPPYDLVEDLDDDNDGMSDLDEDLIGTDPTDPDTDGDGFCDGNGTGDGDCYAGPDSAPLDPLLPVNTDGDAYPDIDPDGEGGLIADDDDDNDGFLDTREVDCASDPLDATDIPTNMDGDGFCDELDDDIDGDGLFNILETNTGIYDSSFDTGTDPRNPDTDGDGVCDGPASPVTSNCTAGPDAFPNDPAAYTDTDGDGYPDEMFGNSTSEPPLELDLDDDGDDWSDLDEVACGTDSLNASSVPLDTDSDGICDALDEMMDLPFTLTYPTNNLELTVGDKMTPLLPNLTGLGGVATWEISGDLPEGLTFGWSPARDAMLDGSIRGTPSQQGTIMTFTIWANNSVHSESFDISLTISEEIENDDGFGWMWCFPILILLLLLLLIPIILQRDKILLLLADGPEPENTTSLPEFVSGAGTEEDPFILQAIENLEPGDSAHSIEVITITNMSDISVEMVDFNQEENGNKFSMFETTFDEIGTRSVVVGEDGAITINILFDDSEDTPTFEGGEYSGLLKLGRASVYLSWSVTVKKNMSLKKKFEKADKAAKAKSAKAAKAKATKDAKSAKVAEEKDAKDAKAKTDADSKAAKADKATKAKDAKSAKATEEKGAKDAKAKDAKATKAKAAEVKPVSKEEKKQAQLKRVQSNASSIDFATLGIASASDKDNLQELKGIGPFIEEKLNALGIYRFEQLAKMTSEIEEEVNVAIEFFPGRVKRDQWAKQAKNLND